MTAEDEPVMSETPTLPCPRCGAIDAVRIEHGYPGVEMFEAAERGEIRLGSLVGPESPEFECLGCAAALPWVADRGSEPEENEDFDEAGVGIMAAPHTRARR